MLATTLRAHPLLPRQTALISTVYSTHAPSLSLSLTRTHSHALTHARAHTHPQEKMRLEISNQMDEIQKKAIAEKDKIKKEFYKELTKMEKELKKAGSKIVEEMDKVGTLASNPKLRARDMPTACAPPRGVGYL